MNNNTALIALVVLLLIVGGFLYFANRGDDNGLFDDKNGGATTTEEDNGAAGSDEAATSSESTGGTADATLGAVISAKAVLAARLGMNPADIEASSAVPTEWPDGCLGLPKQGEFCTQALVPGYRVTLNAEGKTYVYRTNEFGTKVRLEQ